MNRAHRNVVRCEGWKRHSGYVTIPEALFHGALPIGAVALAPRQAVGSGTDERDRAE